MAEFRFTYKGLGDRKAKVADAEGRGLMMLHDDFDCDWKQGDDPHGTLTFTDQSPPPLLVPVFRDPIAEIDELRAELKAKGLLEK